MSQTAPRSNPQLRPAWHQAFLAMMPAIVTHARIQFRHLDPEAHEEAVQEVVCNACRAYVRLVELGKVAFAYPLVLAKFAVGQTKDGRKVGGHLNLQDILSDYCQRRQEITVERLDRYDQMEGGWLEAVVEDRRTPVPDQVCFRVDFPAWLETLPGRERQVAESLMLGKTNGEAAKEVGVSPSRVSQLRRELEASWFGFHGEEMSIAEKKLKEAA
jgi:hypothetical protein